MIATRLSNKRLPHKNTISMHANRQSWLNGKMTQRSGG